MLLRRVNETMLGAAKVYARTNQAGMMHTLLAGVDLSENGQAMDAIREVGPGQALPGLRPYPGQLRDRLLPLAHHRQQQLRAVGSRRLARPDPTRQRHLEEKSGRIRNAPHGRGGGRSHPGLRESQEGVVSGFERVG